MDKRTTPAQLKPCPLCRSENVEAAISSHGDERNGYGNRWRVKCKDCGCMVERDDEQPKKAPFYAKATGQREAIAAWNQRPAQEAESELVERLRAYHGIVEGWPSQGDKHSLELDAVAWCLDEAADRITRLEAALREAREALEPFKLAADMADDRMLTRFLNTDLPDDTTVLGALNLTLGHLRIARTALGGGV